MNGRTVVVLALSTIAGWFLLAEWPFPDGDTLTRLIFYNRPVVYAALRWTWVAMMFTTPIVAFSTLVSLAFVFMPKRRGASACGKLPPYPDLTHEPGPAIVMGELHHARRAEPSSEPQWLVQGDRGLYTGTMVIGSVGSGKTSCAMRPFSRQLFRWQADDPAKRMGGLVLEVKGDFCAQVKEEMEAAGRADDYIEIGPGGEYVYNPLMAPELDAFSLAYTVASLLINLYGQSAEKFWTQAHTDLIKFCVILMRLLYDYVTLADLYRLAINRELLDAKIEEARRMFAAQAEESPAFIVVDPKAYVEAGPAVINALLAAPLTPSGGGLRMDWSADWEQRFRAAGVPYRTEVREIDEELRKKAEVFAVVQNWYGYWTRIDQRLRTSIVAGIAVFLSIFDADLELRRILCPPKEAFDPELNKDFRLGRPLPKFRELIEQGKVVALRFPVGDNPATARAASVLMKQDYQRAVLSRIPTITEESRPTLLVIDEYHALATVGESDPSGDEKFFALSRQAKCIAIVATQSISSLRSVLPGESWRTLLQTFRTKIFLTLSDDWSAKIASDLCGNEQQMIPQVSISESGQDPSVSVLSGRMTPKRAGTTVSKAFSVQYHPRVQPRQFTLLKNAQAIALVYDGENPHDATLLYLKQHFREPMISWFDLKRKGKI